jgi:hypothetical protein
MPIFRYFVFVGGALLALLFAADHLLPSEPVTQTVATISNEQPMIRIRSDRHLPERVVLDTSQPTITTPIAVAATKPSASSVADITDASANARLRESHAEIMPAVVETAAAGKADVKAKPQASPATPKRKVAKLHHNDRPVMRVAQQPHFGLFDTTW